MGYDEFGRYFFDANDQDDQAELMGRRSERAKQKLLDKILDQEEEQGQLTQDFLTEGQKIQQKRGWTDQQIQEAYKRDPGLKKRLVQKQLLDAEHELERIIEAETTGPTPTGPTPQVSLDALEKKHQALHQAKSEKMKPRGGMPGRALDESDELDIIDGLLAPRPSKTTR